MAAKNSEEPQEAPVRLAAIGDLVHFVNGAQHVPAFVTQPAIRVVDARTSLSVERTALTVFPVGMPPFTDVADYDEAGKPGTWHWPEVAEPTKED